MAYKGLIAGLGNPGARYDGTLHNCGFMFINRLLSLAENEGFVEELSGKKFHAELWSFSLPAIEGKWLAAKPQTFMNDSGKAIQPLLAWHRLAPSDLVVVQDELDLPPGTLRFKFGGGMAGHRGLLSITQSLGTPDYYRIRIGIGKPARQGAVIDWVLSKPPREDQDKISMAINDALETFLIFCNAGAQQAMMYAHSASSR